MRILNQKSALERIRAHLKTSKRATLAVAFWGNGAIEQLHLDKRKKPTTIICNLKMGGSNPYEIARLMQLPSIGPKRVQKDNRLHAKVYLFDNAAIIGSSNASSNGLCQEGDETSGWKEINVEISDRRVLNSLRKIVSDEYGEGLISASDLEEARMAWAKRKIMTAGLTGTLTPLAKMLARDNETDLLSEIYLAAYDSGLGPEAQREEEKLQREFGDNMVLFENWNRLVRDKPVFCFYLPENEVPEYDGLYSVFPNNAASGNQVAVELDRKSNGISMSKRQIPSMRPIFDVLRGSSEWNSAKNGERGICWSLAELKQQMQGAGVQSE